MSLRHVLLVYLESGASTGYDIVRGFRNAYGYLWNASYQQIYRDLTRIHEDAWVSCQQEPSGGGRRPRKHYRLTDRGRRALHEWFATPVRLPRYNDAFMVKVASAHLMADRTPLLEELREVREKYRRYLEGLRRNRALFDAMPEAARHQYRYALLALERGIEINRSWLEWAARLEAELLAEHAPPPPGEAPDHGEVVTAEQAPPFASPGGRL